MEFIIMAGAVLVAAAGIVYWLNVTDEWAERDRLRRFQEAMRAPGMRGPFDDEDAS